jgi:dTDP-4-dehydrorhamnose reductase
LVLTNLCVNKRRQGTVKIAENLKILVTGSNGQLGSELKALAPAHPHIAFTFVDIDEMDLGSDEAIHQFFTGKHFDFVVHCAAYTAVDKAETDQTLAYRVNADAVKAIARQCRDKAMRLVHISTDYVFDGNGNQPIAEDQMPDPVSVYGHSKLAGEKFVLETLDNAYIIRTAWVYSTYGKNFVKTISKLARERESLNVVCDQFGSPTYAHDLAVVILKLIVKVSSNEVDVPGIYHFSNEGAISWYDFAWFIVRYYGLSCKVNPIPTEQYPTPATRPKFSVLNKSRLKHTFDIAVPHWYESLEDCLKQMTP